MGMFRRGTLINGEFVEGTFKHDNFVPTKFRRGARGLLVMVARPAKKKARRTRCEQLARILKFEARPTYRPGACGTISRTHFISRD